MKIKGQEITEEIINRIDSKIFEVVEGAHIGCYETTYCKNKYGYPPINIKGKIIYIHRLMYQIHHPDEDIDNLLICHRCDNPACVNPDHLFSGTHQDNSDDRDNKDRQTKGSKITLSKLTEENIVEIVNLTLSGDFTSYEDIVKCYNIKLSNVYSIINQKTWTHITKDFDMVKIKSLLRNDQRGSKNLGAAFNEDQIREIRMRLESGETQTSIANFYGVRQGTISSIALGKSYQNVV